MSGAKSQYAGGEGLKRSVAAHPVEPVGDGVQVVWVVVALESAPDLVAPRDHGHARGHREKAEPRARGQLLPARRPGLIPREVVRRPSAGRTVGPGLRV